MTSQRIIFTVNNVTISHNAATMELSVEGVQLSLSTERGSFWWVLNYDSEKEARSAFNRVNTALADGEPVVYLPGPGFTRKMDEED